jgi:superfamily II DNA/RNA helicase
MNLDAKILQAIKLNKYDEPTDIQKEAIPLILAGGDVMAASQTGSGKTAAFVLPALQLLFTPRTIQGRGPRVVILTPTRELADQVAEVVQNMSKFTPCRFGTITGGVPYFSQERLLRAPFDILVATPGRLMDHMNQGRVDFSGVQLVVLDEADRMLDMGFQQDIETILEPMPIGRQIALFSATLEGPVLRVANRFLKNPSRVQLNSNLKPNTLISQRVVQADDFNHKRALLAHILEEPDMWQAVVFAGTKRGVEELVDDLSSQRINCSGLHGDMRQSKRTRTIDRMHNEQCRVLVATDVAARGLDLKKLTHVINFDLPKSAEDYIHRIGRTGRCGETGIAISLIGPKDWQQLARIEKFTGQRLERKIIAGLEPKNREPKSGPGGPGMDRNRRSGGSGSSERRGFSQNNRSFGKPKQRPGFARSENQGFSRGEGQGQGVSQGRFRGSDSAASRSNSGGQGGYRGQGEGRPRGAQTAAGRGAQGGGYQGRGGQGRGAGGGYQGQQGQSGGRRTARKELGDAYS